MRGTFKLGLLASLVVTSACNDAAGSVSAVAPTAALLINGVANPWVAAGASMAGERADQLYSSGQLTDVMLGAGIAQRYTEIWSSFEDPITPAQALANIDWITTRLTSAPAGALTACARAELMRQALHVRSLITRASTPGAVPPSQLDVTPYNKGSWPWGSCPAPLPAQSLAVTMADGRATVTWSYNSTGHNEEFVVQEVTASGLQPRSYRLDANDCGDSALGNCAAGQRLVSFAATGTNIIVQVDACAGLTCTPARAAVRVPDAIGDIQFTAQATGLLLTWLPVTGTEYYEITRNGLARAIQVTQPSYSDLAARAPGFTYTYTIKACNLLGCSAGYTESFRR